MTYSIRHCVASSKSEIDRAVLVNSEGSPFFWPNVYLAAHYAGHAYSSTTKILAALGMLYEWATEIADIDLDLKLSQGPLLTLAQVEDLALFLRYSRRGQAEIIKARRKVRAAIRPLKVESLRGGFRSSTPHAEVARGPAPALRIRWIAKYLEYMVTNRLWKPSEAANRVPLGQQLDLIIKRLLSLKPRIKVKQIDESRGGITQEEEDLIDAALAVEAEQNPFSTLFHKRRNLAMWRLFCDTGGRRNELRRLLTSQFDLANRTVGITESKTRCRTVPYSEATARAIHDFIRLDRSRTPANRLGHGLLFVGRNGKGLSNQTINLVFKTIREKVPGATHRLTPHVLRHTWNERLGETIDSLPPSERPSESEEKFIRTRLQGWSTKSSMPERYSSRHIQRKSDQIAEKLFQRRGNS